MRVAIVARTWRLGARGGAAARIRWSEPGGTDWTLHVTTATLDRMKTIAVAQFKAQCLWIVDHLDPDGLIITKRGRPVARLLPIERSSADLVGCLAGLIRVNGDVLSTGASWDSLDQP